MNIGKEMSTSTTLITKELYEDAVKALSKIGETNRIALRLRAIISAKEHGVNVVAKVFDIATNTLRNWVKSFESGGVDALTYEKGRGRKSKLSDEHCSAILKWVKEDCNLTLNMIVVMLGERFNIDTSKSAVHRVLLNQNLSYITPRPRHYKQDSSQRSEFKKKSK